MRRLSAVLIASSFVSFSQALAGQAEVLSAPVSVDRFGPPTLQVNGVGHNEVPYQVTSPKVKFAGTVSQEAVAVEIVDGATTIARAERIGRGWSATVTRLTPGFHVIRAYAINAAGERSGPSKVHRIVVPAPEVLTLEGVVSDGRAIRLNGLSRNGNLGTDVAAVGDINGDGIEDLAMLEPNASLPKAEKGGVIYVLFGRNDLATQPPHLAMLDGTNGFRVVGAARGQRPRKISAAGDINGDGFDDLLITSDGFGKGFEDAASWLTIVFGGSSAFPAVVPLGTVAGTLGVRFEGQSGEYGVVGLGGGGDFNADGVSDAVIGMSHDRCLSAFVIYGRIDGGLQPVNLFSEFTAETGVRINVTCDFGFMEAASFVGDVNGDGIDDLALGSTGSYQNSVAIVYGQQSRKQPTIDVRTMGLNVGFQIISKGVGSGLGKSISGQHDIDGDGRDDLAIASDRNSSALVVKGREGLFPRRLDRLDMVRTDGFAVTNITSPTFESPGGLVSMSRDMNGDGRADFVLSTSDYRRTFERYGPRGASIFVVYGRGKLFPESIPLEGITAEQGFRLDAPLEEGGYARDIATGDFNADGYADLMVGSPFAQKGLKFNGSVHILFGRAPDPVDD